MLTEADGLNGADLANGKMLPPVFMMGCERSGTTLLSRVLDSHSRLSIYFESYYYSIFLRELPYYGDLKRTSNLNVFLDDFLALTRMQGNFTPSLKELKENLAWPSFESIFTTFLHLFALKNGKFRGGEKTPSNFYYLSEILEQHPRSPVLFIVRDPRDTVLSIRNAFNTTITGAVQQWNDAFNQYREHLDRVHLVRYEDLVQEPTAALYDICKFIEEPYEEQLLRFSEKIEGRLHGHYLHENLLAPMNGSSIGKFKAMPANEIALIERECRAGMAFLGYQACLPSEANGSDKIATGVKPENPVPDINNIADRLRYYAMRPHRLRKGSFRWRLAVRTRARYWLTLKPLWDKA